MIEAEYEALGGDAFRAQFGDELTDKLVKAALVRQMQAEMERDTLFKRVYYHDQASHVVAAYLEDKRPQGVYRQDGILKLAGGKFVEMPIANREHLLAWALQENDERNLAYVKSRLDYWDAHPQCNTLAELEGGCKP